MDLETSTGTENVGSTTDTLPCSVHRENCLLLVQKTTESSENTVKICEQAFVNYQRFSLLRWWPHLFSYISPKLISKSW